MTSGPLPPWLRPVAWPLAGIYGASVWLRNRAYDSGRGVARLPVAVVSVGNLSVGGSGKTPLVAAVARELGALGAPVAVVSRGYGRRDRSPFVLVSDGKDVLAGVEEAGDEPLELARELPGVAVAVGPDRYEVGRQILQTVGSRVLVLDDGFQHRRLHRDLDLVCFDAGEATENLRLLPVGRLREPLASLSRAHALVWTGGMGGEPEGALVEAVVAAAPSELPVLHAPTRVRGFSPLGPSVVKGALAPDAFADVPVGLLAGVARPDRLLASAPYRTVAERFAPDHHWWRAGEVLRLAEEAKEKGAQALLTTGKDAVKLGPLLLSGALRPPLPLYAIRVEAEVRERDVLRDLLLGLPGT